MSTNGSTATEGEHPHKVAGQQMLLFLSEVAAAARGEHSLEVVAIIAGVSPRTVRRFEDGEHWPHDLDRILAVYAHLGGIKDPREMWRDALDCWYDHGTQPRRLDAHERRVAEVLTRPRNDERPRPESRPYRQR